MKFFSVFDKATGAYMRPWTALSMGQASRMFEDEVNRADSEVGRHPEDYALFEIGSFDDQKGELIGCEPACVCRAHELLARGNDTDQTDAFDGIKEVM